MQAPTVLLPLLLLAVVAVHPVLPVSSTDSGFETQPNTVDSSVCMYVTSPLSSGCRNTIQSRSETIDKQSIPMSVDRPNYNMLVLQVLLAALLVKFSSAVNGLRITTDVAGPGICEPIASGEIYDLFGRTRLIHCLASDDDYTNQPIDYLRTFGHGF